MGDRANVLVKSNKTESGIYFYTHWSGYNLPQTVQTALKRKQRWDDESYLNRIIFSEMIKDSVEEETGYGISTFTPDGDTRIIEINHEKQTVTFKDHTYSFSEYIKLDLEQFDF